MTTPDQPGQQPLPPTTPFGAVPPGETPQPAPPAPDGTPYAQVAPGGFPPPAPAANRRPWLKPTLIGAAVALVLCCCGGAVIGMTADEPKKVETSATSSPAAQASVGAVAATAAPAAPTTPPAAPPATSAPARTTAAPAKPKGYGIGDKVRGGDFEFVVHSMKCGITRVGTSFLNTKPQGVFCKADISVKNVTKSAHTFHADGTVTAQDSAGREYDADGTAAMYGNDDAAGFLDEINPGNSVRANVYFDVPKGTKLKSITFDAGLFTLAEDAVVNL